MTTVLVILGCIVLFVVIKMLQSASPKGFAKQLAKVQLHAIRRQKEIHPEYPKEKLYVEVIKTRPGYSEQMARDIIAYAKETYAEGRDLNFHMVVSALALYEFRVRMKRDLGFEEMSKLSKGIFAAIPYEKLVYFGDVSSPIWDGKINGHK